MCGICGVIQIGGRPREVIDSGRLDAMTDAMVHRGPDDRGTVAGPGFAIGVRRLSIVDIAGGHQPLTNEDGSVIAAQNGELYNHVDLRSRLERDGHRLQSRCDTEILPHLYEEHGDTYPVELRGKFSTIVWDNHRRRAVLARDRLGVKPLYWSVVDDLVVFASELKSVLASGLVPRELDLEAVDLFLTLGYTPGPRTLLKAVKKVTPGSTLAVGEGRIEVHQYWHYPKPDPERRVRPVHEYAEELRALLRAAVRDRLMSDVPLGAMLSGGLDSSLIVALMAEELDRPVDTFTVGFREDAENELAAARRVASELGCAHHELQLSLSGNQLVPLDELVQHLDEPVADLSTLGFDLLSSLAREHVTVALAGQGADELFGGYPKHVAMAAIARVPRFPEVIRRQLARIPLPSGRGSRALGAFAAADPAERLLAVSGRLTPSARTALYGERLEGVDEDTALGAIRAALDGTQGDALSVGLYLDAKLALVDHMLLYFDKCSMAHSLEVRVPYLDHRLVEWAATVPNQMKVKGRLTKRVLREAAGGLVSPASIHKPKVGFLRFAQEAWLTTQLNGAAGDRLRRGDAPHTEFVRAATVRDLVERYGRSPNEDDARLVLAIMMLDSWLTTFG